MSDQTNAVRILTKNQYCTYLLSFNYHILLLIFGFLLLTSLPSPPFSPSDAYPTLLKLRSVQLGFTNTFIRQFS